MKILIATDSFDPQINGVVTTLKAYERELKKQGDEVMFVEPNMFFNIPTPGYKEIPISFPINIKRMIKEFKPDAIHVHTEGSIGIATGRVCRKLGIPYTTGYATHFAEMVHKKYHIPEKWTWWYLRKHHNCASRVMVATDALVDELHSFGIQKVVTVGKGIDTTLYNSSHRNTFTMPFEGPIWLYVGRISVEKNLEEFLKLDLPGTKVCVGRGPNLNQYKKKYPYTQFVGHKTGVALAQWYANSDVFVFPSRWDTFGLVMLESGACGTPVAAYPVRGPLQAIKHGVSGYLHDDLRTACLATQTLDRKKVEEFVRDTFCWTRVINNVKKNLEIIQWSY
ncbi:MAG: glycosyltransferase family 1 protein [Richelia sp. RM2_1_2]|nr:glycosyltransferase family 1 protein [Richelia sp. RM2_1_2]